MTTIEDRLREGARDVQAAIANMEQRTLSGSPHRPEPAVAFVAVFLAVLMIGFMVVMLRGESASSVVSQPPAQTVTTTSLVDDSGIPRSLLDYWALEGTLESVGDEDVWLCPSWPSVGGYSVQVAEDSIPEEFILSLPDVEPIEVSNWAERPICRQPHVLVLFALADGKTLASGVLAGMAVWPQVTRFNDPCCLTETTMAFVGGPVTEPTINGHPALLHLHAETGHISVWWVDASGTPMYAETSGLSQERVLELVGSIDIDPVAHRAAVDADALEDLQVFSDRESVGVWERSYSRAVVYSIDGLEVAVTTSLDASFDAYARFAPYVKGLSIVEVHDRPAVWIPVDSGFLIFSNADDIQVVIHGAPDLDEAIALAEQLG
jgi:hypothetical protein